MTDTQITALLPQLSVTLAALLLIAWRAPLIMEGGRKWVEAINDGKKQDFAAQASVVAAGTEAMQIAVGVLRDVSDRDRKSVV